MNAPLNHLPLATRITAHPPIDFGKKFVDAQIVKRRIVVKATTIFSTFVSTSICVT